MKRRTLSQRPKHSPFYVLPRHLNTSSALGVLSPPRSAKVKSIQSRGEGVRVGNPGQYMDSVTRMHAPCKQRC